MQHVVFLYLLAEAANFLRKWNANAHQRQMNGNSCENLF